MAAFNWTLQGRAISSGWRLLFFFSNYKIKTRLKKAKVNG